MQRAGGLENVDDRNALDEVNRFGVNPVNEVHFTVHHSVLACGDVDEGQHGHRVKVPTTFFPVVGVFEPARTPGSKFFSLNGPVPIPDAQPICHL